MSDFDIIVVGGGLAGSSFAIVMARHGAKVLVLEQEARFRDRIRGEFLVPWGTAEARKLGLVEILKSGGAREVPWLETGTGPRDLIATTPQQEAALSYFHPQVQEALIAAAQQAGADVRRGVTVERIEPGAEPGVECRGNSASERVTARLIVAADGRNSAARRWGAFVSNRDEHPSLVAGVLLRDVSGREDLATVIHNPDLGSVAAAFPIGDRRSRAYFGYQTSSGYRMQGREKLPLFLSESIRSAPIFEGIYSTAKDCGPLASFETSDAWVEHPYRDGLALIGDAAATSDPCFGQGMGLTLRDVRVLRDHLGADSDWNRSAHAYAAEHDSYFARCHKASGWLRFIFQDPTPAAALQRQKAMPLIAQDPTRVPDHTAGGPDLPTDDSVRDRFFGEI